MVDNKVECNFCENEVEDGKFFYTYAVLVDTDKRVLYKGLNKVLQELADYLMGKNYHLSASQCLLFRQDVVNEYLQKTLDEGEKINIYYLKKYAICLECFEGFKEVVPLR